MLRKIPKTVVVLGLVSLLNDMASEMIYPIIPIFITTVLGANVALLGLIEGIAEATAAITKYFFGTYSDYLQRRKVFVVGGYSLSAVSKLVIGAATIWPVVLFGRFIDRLGKGVRTAARDSILLENTSPTNKGFIFGFHRTMDSLGAVIGPLLAIGVLELFKQNLRLTFFIAFVPGVIAIALAFFFVKEKHHHGVEKKNAIQLSWRGLNNKLKLFLIISCVFALGNSSDTFLLLRAKTLGLTTITVILVYVLYNLSYSLFSTPAGKLSDIFGAKKIYALGLLVFALVYFLFGSLQQTSVLWILFPVYGIYIAATDGVSKAYVGEFITQKESGTYFGLYYTLTAVAAFVASLAAGLLWQMIGPSAAFYYGSLMAGLAFVLFFFL